MTNLLSFLFTVCVMWNPSPDCVDGYRVYRRSSMLLDHAPMVDFVDVGDVLEFWDAVPANEYNYYAVTALENGVESEPNKGAWIYFARP